MNAKEEIAAETIESALHRLASDHAVFCSEADFQHTLAWELHRALKPDRLRLEYPLDAAANQRLDIWLRTAEGAAAIELKYKTRGLIYRDAGVETEALRLRNQAAQNLARYDFLKDISRLERYVGHHPRAVGYAIFLTNDACYWQPPAHPGTCDAAFRIHEGRSITSVAVLQWGAAASPGTRTGRGEAIPLAGTYVFTWQPYATVPGQGHQEFRYLLVGVGDEIRVSA